MVLRAITTAAKAAAKAPKVVKAIDKWISSAAKMGRTLNKAADKKSAEKFYKTVDRRDKADARAKTATWVLGKKIANKVADRAKAAYQKDRVRDLKVFRTAEKVDKYLSKYSK